MAKNHGRLHAGELVLGVGVQDQRDGQSDVFRSSADHYRFAFGLDVDPLQHLDDAERGARHEAVHVQAQLADVGDVEAIHVFSRIDRIANVPLVYVVRYRQLDQNCIHGVIGVQLLDFTDQFRLGYAAREIYRFACYACKV